PASAWPHLQGSFHQSAFSPAHSVAPWYTKSGVLLIRLGASFRGAPLSLVLKGGLSPTCLLLFL
ncbi:MAG TPA: hypothetical protein VEC08_05350, partial [Nitrososphaerales archaeon]|nr:hypothetical protein [Nitrososphaerales archaeon]